MVCRSQLDFVCRGLKGILIFRDIRTASVYLLDRKTVRSADLLCIIGKRLLASME